MVLPSSPPWVAVIALESVMLLGMAYVAVQQGRVGINGPCRLCLALLLAWRVSVIVTMQCAPPCWDYLWGVLFGYSFLYATHHLAEVVWQLREREGLRTAVGSAASDPQRRC